MVIGKHILIIGTVLISWHGFTMKGKIRNEDVFYYSEGFTSFEKYTTLGVQTFADIIFRRFHEFLPFIANFWSRDSLCMRKFVPLK